jgi:hypothetical protein
LHKALELPKEEFQRAVERELTGKIAEPWEIIYFKLYESQIPVIDRAWRQQRSCWAATPPAATVWR